MIEFKIISTADKSQISTYQHFGSELTMGSTEGEMLIDDPQLAPLQLRVRVAGGRASLENLGNQVEVRLNGKAIDGEVPLKEKDNVSIGKTSIQFLRLDLSTPTPPDPVEYRNAAGRFTPGSKEQAMLDALSLLERQTATSFTSAPPPPPRAGGAKPPPLPGRAPPLPPGSPPLPPLPKKS